MLTIKDFENIKWGLQAVMNINELSNKEIQTIINYIDSKMSEENKGEK